MLVKSAVTKWKETMDIPMQAAAQPLYFQVHRRVIMTSTGKTLRVRASLQLWGKLRPHDPFPAFESELATFGSRFTAPAFPVEFATSVLSSQ